MYVVKMFNCFVFVFSCLALFFGNSSAILVKTQDAPKRSYSSGIKTTNWRNSSSHPTTHQNYSKVIVHNNPNQAGHYVITKTQETKTIYPVYNGHSYGQRSDNKRNILETQSHTDIDVNDISRNNKTIYKRKVEYKSFEVYEKCPTGESGQFVYAFSCNQFLNCWKGRGITQNCAPGTMFNPKSLECDFPDKVECITGPRLNSLEIGKRVAKSVQQVNCPEGFSGLIPNYTDCSKFISCNNGHSMPMDCPPGTLFDTSKNVCDHPKKCTCFDGKSGTEVRIQQGQWGQQTGGASSPDRGCHQPAGNCDQQPSSGHGQFGGSLGNQEYHQTQYGIHGQNAHTNTDQSGSGFQTYPGSGVEAQSQQNIYSVTYNGTQCNPQYQNCGQNPIGSSSGNQKFYQTQYGSHRQNAHTNTDQSGSGFQTYPGSGVGTQDQQNIYSVTYNWTQCNPQYQNCGPNSIGTSSGNQQTQYGSHRQNAQTNTDQSGSGFQTYPGSGVGAQDQQSIYSVTYNRTQCNPQYQNCGPNPIGTSSGNQQTQYGSHRHNAQTNTDQSGSGFQNYPGSGVGAQDQQSIYSVTYNRTQCNPQYQNCGPNPIGTSSGNQQFHQTQYGSHRQNAQTNTNQSGSGIQIYPGSGVGTQGQQNTYSVNYNRTSCNPQYQSCGQNQGYPGNPFLNPQSNQKFYQTTYGRHEEGPITNPQQISSGSQTTSWSSAGNQQQNCNPQYQNCGSSQIPAEVKQTNIHTQSTHGGNQYASSGRPSIYGQEQTIYSSHNQDSSDVRPSTFEQGSTIHAGCNPQKQQCNQNIGQSTTHYQSTNYDGQTNDLGYGHAPDQTYIHRQNCDPSVQNCQNAQRMDQSCNLSNQNCGQSTGKAGEPSACDPQLQNCGQVPQRRSGQVSCDLSKRNCGQQQTTYGGTQSQNHGSTAGGRNYNTVCNLNDRNCQGHSIVAKDTRHGEAKCPDDFQGITKHPFECSKFLNCANGRTFVQDCAPGTLFNQKLGNCDFPYNVDCESSGAVEGSETTISGDWVREYEEHVQQFGQNPGHGNVRSTTERQRPSQGQEVIVDINRGEIGVVSRPTHERSTSRPSHIDDVESFDPTDVLRASSTQRSVWPPPFPKTNDVDYDFDYGNGEPVTLKPEDVFNADRKKSSVCEESDFRCAGDVCITQTMVCDGHRDCSDGKDEMLCEEYISRFSVHKNSQLVVKENQKWINASYATCAMLCIQNTKFICRSFNYRRVDRTCFLSDQNIGLSGALRSFFPVDYYELKAGTVDCSDPTKYYECNNKKCIMKEQVCDGADDCGKRQDEKYCKAEEFGYSVKLAGSKKPNEGRIEVTAFGRTGYICDDQFGMADANVVCKELGFALGAATVIGHSHFAKDLEEKNTQYMMDDIECLGNETTLLDCEFADWGKHDCGDQEIAGVVCKTPQENCGQGYWKCATVGECVPYEFVCDGVNDCADDSDEKDQLCEASTEIRLVNGSVPSEGRLEIRHHGIWGTVCDDDFNEDAAKVVCKQFGYQGRVFVRKEGYFGEGDGPIWLDQVSCDGNETKLESCAHWTWGEHNCEHDEDVGVTCTDQLNEVDVQRSAKLPPTSSTFEAHRCGFRKDIQLVKEDLIQARVVAGSVVAEGEYPWQAALKVRVKDKSAHWCGAVIVSSKWVLTAAHCLQGYTKGAYVIVAGEYDTDAEAGTEQRKFIDEFFVHERFRQGHRMNNDIALIKVKGSGFELNDDVQAICLPDPDADYDRDLNCTISGFGSVKSGKSAYSHKLMAAWVPIHSKEICKMPHVYGDSITDGMICAGFLDGGVDACDGDSGGPLACLDQGVFTLYGLTSWGQHCGYANKPGVYVKVAYYRAWIEDIIQKHST